VLNILELVLTNILEGNPKPAKTSLRVFFYSARDADTARLRQCLESRRNVYSITMDASTLYDIADVDAHPEIDLPICWHLSISLAHCTLDLDGTTQGIHGADEQDQQAVARCPYDPTTVFFDLGFNELSIVSVQLREGTFIIDTYQAAVSGYIRHQDCHKSAFDFLTGHG